MENEKPRNDELFVPLMYTNLPQEFQKKMEKELNETKDKLEKGLHTLKECIPREHLPLSSTDEDFLLMFLRWAKYDLKKAKEKLKSFMKCREKSVEYLMNTSMDRIAAVVDNHFIGLLPYRDKEGAAVAFSRASCWNEELFDMNDVAVCLNAFLLFVHKFPLTSVAGVCFMDEARVESIYHIFPIFKGILKYLPLLHHYPFRFKRVDAFREHYLCHRFGVVLRHVLPQKLKDRLFMHGDNLELMHKIYPPSMLPSEFGGTMGCISTDFYRKEFLEFVQKLKSEWFQGK